MDVIWETDELMVRKHDDEDLLDFITSPHNNLFVRVIDIGTDEITAFARHWIDLVEEEARQPDLDKENEMGVIWRADDTILSSSKDNAILKNTRNGETYKIVIWKHAFTEICLHWLDLQGYDVVKREPELLPCPFCGGECYTWNPAENDWSAACQDCTYNSGCGDSESEAIRLHNLIADNARTRKEK